MARAPLVTCQLSVSLDGYLAGPRQSVQDPLGVGGEQLHAWAFGPAGSPEDAVPVDPVDARVRDAGLDGLGAFVMGRHMFGPDRGPWDGSTWTGWWGPEPPYHAPVLVLTHHEREPVEMAGGTTFHFVTEGVEAAVARAKELAGDLDVGVAGGASTVRQVLAAGLLDRMTLHVVPLLLGGGERLLDGPAGTRLVQEEVVVSPVATHVIYRVER